MQRLVTRSFFTAAIMAAFALSSGSPLVAQDGIAGDWEGAIDAGGQMIEMAMTVTAGEDGTLSATMDVPSQGGFGIPLEDVMLEDGKFTFGLSTVPGGASYEGVLSEDGSTIEGTWTQGPNSVPLNMTRSEG